ncbi:potassium channel family protein [Phenylobacterium terrae]|uniref:Potassium channel family protein n=2 Tax=Phenylobacterium terrae TaxID=2665495 RepID=A0ABW4N654_9CAUL
MGASGEPAVQRPAWRRRLYSHLETGAGPGRLSPLNLALCLAIAASTAVAVAETEPLIAARFARSLRASEIAFALLFAAEYLARLWAAPEGEPDSPAWKARLRWILSPPALADLLAVLPVLLTLAGAPTLVLRLIRVLRILRLASLGPTSNPFDLVLHTVWSKRRELGAAYALGGVALLLASSLLYAIEGAVQPEAFGSIPRALWWGVTTLTTIGYGDVHPITPFGKIAAGLTAVTGVGLIAAPAGILAAAFTDALGSDKPPADPAHESGLAAPRAGRDARKIA